MPIPSLAKVFGPTIVGHSSPNPDPATIWKETSLQPKVCGLVITLQHTHTSQCVLNLLYTNTVYLRCKS